MSGGVDIEPFKRLIKERCGLHFEAHDEQKLAAILTGRVRQKAKLTMGGYLKLLHTDEREFQALVNLLTVNETYFFREPDQISLLVERLVPRLLAKATSTAPLRILSAGCSSGEEPYSLMMALSEKYGANAARLFAVTGGDLDTAVLDKARRGRYPEFSFRGVPAGIRSRYFVANDGEYVLHDSIRKHVKFYELNLLADGFSPFLLDFDIIFFRNVSIYFDEPTRRVIQQNLRLLMKQDGYLVIGTSETLANDFGQMPLIEEEGLFYFAKGEPPLPSKKPHSKPQQRMSTVQPLVVTPVSASLPLPPPPAPPTVVTQASSRDTTPDLERALSLTREARFDAALPVIKALLDVNPANTQALLLQSHIMLNRKDFAAAERLAQEALTLTPWSADALLMLGLVAKWRDEAEAAIKWFKQAVYGHHECWPAHYYLAELYRKLDDGEQAQRAYRVVLQLLDGAKEPETGIKIVPLGLPSVEVSFLCEHQLQKLGGNKKVASRSAKPATVIPR